jgi:uncharacterized protein YndB with AHSA1/START domain
MSSKDTDESLVYECDLAEPPEKVWRALTVPELVSEWLLPPDAETCDAPVECELIESEKNEWVSYLWRRGDEPETFVTFEVAPLVNGGTHLRLTHSVEPLEIYGPICMSKAA